MNKILKNSIILSFFFLGYQLKAQDAVWLSNTPPESMEEMVKTSGMHRLSALDIKKTKGKPKRESGESKYSSAKKDSIQKNKPKKAVKNGKRPYRPSTKYIQWIRKGNSILDSKYICLDKKTDYQLSLLSPMGKKEKIELIKSETCFVKFELKEEGYYNAYLKIKKGTGDTLHINIAKAELLSHSCRNGHHKKLEARSVRTYPEITEFEVIRVRKPYENYHYFTTSGDNETYKVLYLGKPVQGVKVTLNTEKGWSKSFFTNEMGIFSTEFIQDYFSKWKELNKREIFYYMLRADYTIKKDVSYKDKHYNYIHYTLTMSDGYHPSKTMYSSMVWALIVFVITLIVSISGIFFYKERRKRPYKEIEFNESNN